MSLTPTLSKIFQLNNGQADEWIPSKALSIIDKSAWFHYKKKSTSALIKLPNMEQSPSIHDKEVEKHWGTKI